MKHYITVTSKHLGFSVDRKVDTQELTSFNNLTVEEALQILINENELTLNMYCNRPHVSRVR